MVRGDENLVVDNYYLVYYCFLLLNFVTSVMESTLTLKNKGMLSYFESVDNHNLKRLS